MSNNDKPTIKIGQAIAGIRNDDKPISKLGSAIAELKSSENPNETTLGKAILQLLEKNPVVVENVKTAILSFGKFAQEVLLPAVATIIEVGRTISTFIGETVRQMHESYAARLDAYPDFLKMIPALAQRGWFVSESLALHQIDDVAVRASNSKIDEIDSLLLDLYRENIDGLGEALVHLFPSKSFLIEPALTAHRRGEYGVSIPLFFILTDGICFETVKRFVFQARNENEKLSVLASGKLALPEPEEEQNVIVGFYNALSKAMWSALSTRLPLAYNQKERDLYSYSGLNRHTIMHGIAGQEYATEVNSLKAFSLLSHLAALTHEDRWQNQLLATYGSGKQETHKSKERNSNQGV